MFELLWGLLNFVLGIFFIFLCFKSTKLIRESLGLFAAVIFVLGIFSFIAKSEKESPALKNFDFYNQSQKKEIFEGNTFATRVKLEDNLATSIHLNILAGMKEGEIKVLSASCYRNGLIAGSSWDLTDIAILKISNNDYSYDVTGHIKWNILGINLFTENKDFNGKIKLED